MKIYHRIFESYLCKQILLLYPENISYISDSAIAMPPKKRESDKSNADAPPAKMNRTASDFESLDFSSAAETKDGKKWNFKISTWNVDGLRAWIKKGGLDFLKHEKPDVLCLQETKCSEEKLPDEIKVRRKRVLRKFFVY